MPNILKFGYFDPARRAVGSPLIYHQRFFFEEIGGLLVLFGIAMLLGRHITTSIAARLAGRLRNPGKVSVGGFFIFGVAYATASLSCTLPVFLIVVGGSLAANGFGAAVLQFVSYAIGMGLVILFLTLSIALCLGAIMTQFRTILPFVERGSALLMIGAGVYIVYYWQIKGGLLETLIQGVCMLAIFITV